MRDRLAGLETIGMQDFRENVLDFARAIEPMLQLVEGPHGLDEWTAHNERSTRDSQMRRLVRASAGRQWERVTLPSEIGEGDRIYYVDQDGYVDLGGLELRSGQTLSMSVGVPPEVARRFLHLECAPAPVPAILRRQAD